MFQSQVKWSQEGEELGLQTVKESRLNHKDRRNVGCAVVEQCRRAQVEYAQFGRPHSRGRGYPQRRPGGRCKVTESVEVVQVPACEW